jgi:predicted nucleic acid-binding protein
MDLLSAATATRHSARLCTHNANDFDGVDDLVDVMTV